MFWSTNFSTKYRNKNSKSEEKKNIAKISGGQSKIVFVFFFHRPLENFDVPLYALLILANQPNGISTIQNAIFIESPIVFFLLHFFLIVVVAICSVFLFTMWCFCYNSRVDQIKLKHITAYNLFKSD